MATVPIPGDGVDQGSVDATTFNTKLVDPINFLQNPPLAVLRQTVAQTLANNTSTVITFTTEDEDSENGHDNSTNPSRYTAVYAGWYWVAGAICYSTSATGARYTWLRVNGSDLNGSMSSLPTVSSADFAGVATRARLVSLVVGDYVELVGHQTSGGNLDTVISPARNQSTLSIVWASRQ